MAEAKSASLKAEEIKFLEASDKTTLEAVKEVRLIVVDAVMVTAFSEPIPVTLSESEIKIPEF